MTLLLCCCASLRLPLHLLLLQAAVMACVVSLVPATSLWQTVVALVAAAGKQDLVSEAMLFWSKVDEEHCGHYEALAAAVLEVPLEQFDVSQSWCDVCTGTV